MSAGFSYLGKDGMELEANKIAREGKSSAGLVGGVIVILFEQSNTFSLNSYLQCKSVGFIATFLF